MYIIAIAWIYVVLLMSLTEHSVIAGIMTFLIYCLFPLALILYVFGAPMRKRKRDAAEKLKKSQQDSAQLQPSLGESAASEPPQH